LKGLSSSDDFIKAEGQNVFATERPGRSLSLNLND
jgi:hypothetical protein